MITEDYVSFETAKLLKEKGFDDEYTNAFYDKTGNLYFIDLLSDFSEHPDNDTDIAAPTLYVAMKWLREKYKLHIITLPYAPFDRHSYHPGFEADMVYIAQLFRGIIPIDEVGRSIIKLTHEEACEAAIKYCLENLI